MNDNKMLADLLFPDVKSSPQEFETRFPLRELNENAFVTRFAPSPTGFIHIGGLYAALTSERMAHQSGGVFFLRIEDTDKKREIEGGIEEIIKAFAQFNIYFDEGMTSMDEYKGIYGPYKQSERKEIYQTFIKKLVQEGHAYPCFCTEEELASSRSEQETLKIRPGYYGKWAKHRDIRLDEVTKFLSEKKPFVIRLRSNGDPEVRIVLEDLIRGRVEIPENDQDTVILKSDGIPTYHFAHAVDDHFMRTTHVIRGDEWLSSIPLHIQLFQILGWDPPKYAHISPIMKMEDTSKRKLSKRKDPEAAVTYYHEQGYPNDAVIEYLLNLVNSSFEDWRRENPETNYAEFEVKLENMSISGSLFDIVKLTDISKEIIAKYNAKEVFEKTLAWSNEFDKDLYELLLERSEYSMRILNIERNNEKPRKDFGKWSDVRSQIFYFYDNLFEKDLENQGRQLTDAILPSEIVRILERYSEIYNENDTKDEWFDRIKTFCEELGYAANMKMFKKNPSEYKGHIGDVTGIIRVALTNRKNTPDMYEIMQVMGTKHTLARLTGCANQYK